MSQKESLKIVAYQKLKEKILSNDFKPNVYLEEKALCEMLNISRTPIREAINKLEWDNLVQTIPQKGIFVTNLSIQSITELFQARKVIEPVILQLSCRNLDKDQLAYFRERSVHLIEENDIPGLHKLDYEFHNYLNSKCSNRHLTKMMSYISDQFQRVRTQDFYPKPRALRGAKEHIELINALLNEEYDHVSEMLRSHIASTESYYFKSLLSSTEHIDIPDYE